MAKEPSEYRVDTISELYNPEKSLACFATNLKETGIALLNRINGFTGEGEIPLDDLFNKPMLVESFYAHVMEMERTDTGELGRVVRTCLIHPSGTYVSTTSTGVVASMDKILIHHSPGPWNPPLSIMFESRKTAKKRNVYSIKIQTPDAKTTK